MEKTYIFGHKNPDTDSITSSLVMADFEKKKGNAEAVACRLGNVNKETEYVLNYLGIEAPELIENVEDGANVILVDHNSPKDDDRKAVKELAEIAGVNPEIYGLEMLKAGTDLSSFSIDEILHLDAKKIDFKDVKSIVNQVNTADILEVMNLKADLEARMNEIINSNSQVIALGKSASLVEKAYGVKLENNTALLKGVVSRKKQVVPVMTENA